jgi:hypothetical protein
MDTTHTGCDGCPASDAKLYRATQSAGPDFEVYYCDDCAASFQGADMGAGGCDNQGALTPVDPLAAALARRDAVRAADRAQEARLDEQMRAARGEDFAMSQIMRPS